MATKILLTADLHIGVTSSHLGRPERQRDFTTTEAWRRIVDLAKTEHVKAVFLAGDIVDENNKYFEAIGPLQRGIEDLGDAGIVTIAVSGNHDYDVLEPLSSELPSEWYWLLGRDGNWERTSIFDGNNPILHVDGISFATGVMRTSQLESYEFERDQSVPTIGMVHGDLYDKASRYRPLDLRRLQGVDIDGWLLGHIHAPSLFEGKGSPWVLYPGSPQALDPGEQGVHGPWIAEINGGTISTPVQRPLSTAFYAQVDIDLSNVKERDALDGSISTQVADRAREIIEDAGPALLLALLRCRIKGTTPVANEVGAVAGQLKEHLELEIRDTAVVVESYTLDVSPPIDLEQYSGSKSAPGALARLLRGLDESEPTDEVRSLVYQAMEEMKRADTQREFADLERSPITEQVARDYLRTQVQALLAELVKDEL